MATLVRARDLVRQSVLVKEIIVFLQYVLDQTPIHGLAMFVYRFVRVVFQRPVVDIRRTPEFGNQLRGRERPFVLLTVLWYDVPGRRNIYIYIYIYTSITTTV